MSRFTEEHAKVLVSDILKVIDYLRGASPFHDHKELAYILILIRYLNSRFELHSHGIHKDSVRDIVESVVRVLERNHGYLTRLNDEEFYFLIENCRKALDKVNLDTERVILRFFQNHNFDIEDDAFQVAVKSLGKRFAESEAKSGGEFYTPDDVNKLIVSLSGFTENSRVLDPFAGSGGTIVKILEENGSGVVVDGIEINTSTYFQLIVSKLVFGLSGSFQLADSMFQTGHNESAYDLVVSFPPFGMRIPRDKQLDIVNRSAFEGGTNWVSLAGGLPETRTDWLIMLSMLDYAKQGGRVLSCIPSGALSRSGSEDFIRKELVTNGIVDTVILLPNGIHYSSNASSAIIILRNELSKRSAVKFVDASLFFTPKRGRNTLSEEQIDRIVDAANDSNRFSRFVKFEEIARNNFNLSPSTYISKTINLNSIRFENFRGYSDFRLPLHPKLTVLVGENGAGKTSALEGVACAIGPFLTSVPDARGRALRKSDVRISEQGLSGFSRITVDSNSSLSWDLSMRGSAKHSAPNIGVSALGEYAKKVYESNEHLPLIIYYSANRTLLSNSKISVNPFDKPTRVDGYDNALEARINYSAIRSWFSKLEVEELQLRDESKDQELRHPIRHLLTRALNKMVGRVSDIIFDRDDNDVKVVWISDDGKDVELGLEQLSEGYRSMVNLTIDMVKRAYYLNPLAEDPLAVSGVVIIDEIELHLHPRWQQKVLGDLLDLFPKVQFVVSTHSPQVLTTVRGESIRIVSTEYSEAEMVQSPYGGESNRVLEQVLGVDPRPDTEVKTKLKEYFELIEAGKGDQPEGLKLRKEIITLTDGTEPDLDKASLAIKRVNWVKSRKKSD